jgi:translation initiation factor IF-2
MSCSSMRGHQLAKGLGVTSKEVLTRLSTDGVTVSSASARINTLTETRIREFFVSTSRARKTTAPTTQPRSGI